MIFGATPAEVAEVAIAPAIAIRANRHGSLVTGRTGDHVIDYAATLTGPVYDIMYNPRTGWFVVTVYRRGLEAPERWDNRPGTDAGYPRITEVLGAATPTAILAALDVDPDLLGYAPT